MMYFESTLVISLYSSLSKTRTHDWSQTEAVTRIRETIRKWNSFNKWL